MQPKPLLILPTAKGYIVLMVESFAAPDLTTAQCFESLGGRYQVGGLIDAIRDHFEPRKAAE